MFEIAIDRDDPRQLSQARVQITDLLGLYQAELARILRLQCDDIGRLAAGQWCLQPGSSAWDQARLLLAFYQRLHERFNGEAVAMVHWLRVQHAGLDATPHRLMVDEGRLKEVVDWLKWPALQLEDTCPRE